MMRHMELSMSLRDWLVECMTEVKAGIGSDILAGCANDMYRLSMLHPEQVFSGSGQENQYRAIQADFGKVKVSDCLNFAFEGVKWTTEEKIEGACAILAGYSGLEEFCENEKNHLNSEEMNRFFEFTNAVFYYIGKKAGFPNTNLLGDKTGLDSEDLDILDKITAVTQVVLAAQKMETAFKFHALSGQAFKDYLIQRANELKDEKTPYLKPLTLACRVYEARYMCWFQDVFTLNCES